MSEIGRERERDQYYHHRIYNTGPLFSGRVITLKTSSVCASFISIMLCCFRGRYNHRNETVGKPSNIDSFDSTAVQCSRVYTRFRNNFVSSLNSKPSLPKHRRMFSIERWFPNTTHEIVSIYVVVTILSHRRKSQGAKRAPKPLQSHI